MAQYIQLARITVFGVLRIPNNIQQKEMIMNIRKLSFITTTVLFLLVAALLFSASMVYAGGSCKIIKIRKDLAGGGSSLIILPEKATVPVGTCTVWINFVKGSEMNVAFRENAKQCMLATEEQTGFQEIELKTGESCYDSEGLTYGKTASLTWATPGIYKYTLEAPATTGINYAGNMQAEGVIEVTGPETSAAAVPVDTDGDGVPDSEDLCPNTPKGATVNSNGCWVLKGVKLFDFDDSSIKPEGHELLDEVAIILENNPAITGELRGHTDSIGSEEYNKQLSEKRAKAVEEYLENKGIDPSRLTSVGYGESQPIASNETPEGRQENRRVELVRIK
jgi:outer membrane protein OmpA-like peptidoglycan-associated protein